MKGVCADSFCLVAIFTLIRLWCEADWRTGGGSGGGRIRSTKEKLVRMVSWNPEGKEGKSTQCTQQGGVKQLWIQKPD